MRVISASILAIFMLASAPANAQVVDLSTIKCKEFLESGKETIGYIMMWLDGYYSDQDADPVVNFDKMKEKGEKLGEACAKNPTHGLITEAESIFGK